MRIYRNICLIISFLIIFVSIAGCIGDQAAGEGILYFTSSPAGAEVYLDGQYRGSTPVTVPGVVPGDHTIEYRSAGYTTWSTVIAVPSGPFQIYAALAPASGDAAVVTTTAGISHTVTPAAAVTVRLGKDPMIIGDSMTFSGTATGTQNVLLILYGPGYYTYGVILDNPKVTPAGSWSYTWNPGTSVRSGSYTIIVSDARNATSERASFRIIGGGEVSVTPSKYAASPGDTVRFSGRCSTGAQNVKIMLNGPGSYSGGIELGVASVLGDKTWSFSYKLDPTMSTGIYTVYAYDDPKTTVGTSQFTIGFV